MKTCSNWNYFCGYADISSWSLRKLEKTIGAFFTRAMTQPPDSARCEFPERCKARVMASSNTPGANGLIK